MGERLPWAERAYSTEGVERLLGLHESRGKTGHRDVTVLDLVSRSRDPGGMQLVHEKDRERWMARRGLQPESDAAVVLWDFWGAVRHLGREPRDMTYPDGRPRPDAAKRALLLQAVVALTVCGFGEEEIAALIDPEEILAVEPHMDERERRTVRRQWAARSKRVRRALLGRPKRDEQGRAVRQPIERCGKCEASPCDLHGPVVYTGGAAAKIARLMRGEGVVRAS